MALHDTHLLPGCTLTFVALLGGRDLSYTEPDCAFQINLVTFQNVSRCFLHLSFPLFSIITQREPSSQAQ
jgi:hypothetical protein